MSQRVATRLEKIDTNHDGRISTTELEDAIEQLLREEQKHRSYKCMAWGVAGLLLFVLLANLGLAYGERPLVSARGHSQQCKVPRQCCLSSRGP